MRAPAFIVTVPTTDAEDRRWVSVAQVRALSGIPSTVSDATLAINLDAVLSRCADACDLARDRGRPVTLAQETCRATWTGYEVCGQRLLLPHRTPIMSITVSQNEVDLVEDTDFVLDAGRIERLNAGWSGPVVATYVAGWLPDDDEFPPPDGLVQLIASQVRMGYDQLSIDLNLRSEDIPGVWSGTFNVAGGDAVATNGLARPLYDALRPYWAPMLV